MTILISIREENGYRQLMTIYNFQQHFTTTHT
jgi:hypothetical protein